MKMGNYSVLSANARGSRGYTIVELSIVLVLVAVMGAVALPRFAGISSYRLAAAKSELVSLARFAQESALNISDTRDPTDATHDFQRVRVQMVFAPDVDPALSEIRVEVGLTNADCAVIGAPTVLRSVPMYEGLNYPAPATGRLQYDSLGALECPLDNDPVVPDPVPGLDFDLDADGVDDLCIEASGYAHTELVEDADSVIKCYYEFI